MLEEAADELDDIEVEGSFSLAVGFAITNPHGAVLNPDDARIGDGDFENVGGQILQSRLTGAHGLAVHIPVDLPDSGWDLIEQLSLFHEIAELGSEDGREGLDRDKEIGSGGMPGTIGATQSAARNDVVDMGMILKSSSPGVWTDWGRC